MPILNPLQRRSVPGRILIGAFYLMLLPGALCMVYPFLLMLSGSLKSETDGSMELIPSYLVNEQKLFQKFMEQRYGKVSLAAAMTSVRDEQGNQPYSFSQIALPHAPSNQEMADWESFEDTYRTEAPLHDFALGHAYGIKTVSEVGYRTMLAIREAFPSLGSREIPANLPAEEWASRNFRPATGDFSPILEKLRSNLDARYFYPISIEGTYIITSVNLKYGGGARAVTALNKEWNTHHASLYDVVLKERLPENPAEATVWSDFVRNRLSSRFVSLDPAALPDYRAFLKAEYKDMGTFNTVHQTQFTDWAEIDFPSANAPVQAFRDADAFLKSTPDLSLVSIRSPDGEWRRHLSRKYGTIAKLNAAWGSDHANFEEIKMPTASGDLQVLRKHKGEILWEMTTRNFRFAWHEIVSNGNGLRNTVIFCLLNMVMALIINPLAAYGLSRFQPRWGPSVLFILMATMAFPTEVTQIPSFLLLRDLGWLNTFAALVIPAAANGYAIFLLKGFFDSLPKELYEAATIDGCGEWRAFFMIAIPLSAPILAVVALGAFTAAYGAFMFALLVCQKESMWTLMVHLYQMQQFYHPPIVFAGLIIAAIPTLVVFVLCQNVIMRGIVVPVEK